MARFFMINTVGGVRPILFLVLFLASLLETVLTGNIGVALLLFAGIALRIIYLLRVDRLGNLPERRYLNYANMMKWLHFLFWSPYLAWGAAILLYMIRVV